MHKRARIVRMNKKFLTGGWGPFNNILLCGTPSTHKVLTNIFVLESQTAENTDMTDSLGLLEQFVQYTQDSLYAHFHLLLICLCYIRLLLVLERTRAKSNPGSNVGHFSSYLLMFLSSFVFILYFWFCSLFLFFSILFWCLSNMLLLASATSLQGMLRQ